MDEQKQKKPVGKKATIIVNIIIAVIFLLVVLIFINVLLSMGKDYTSFFGKTSLAVRSYSMNGEWGEEKSEKGDGKYTDGFFELVRSEAVKDGVAEDKIATNMVKGFNKNDLIFIDVLSDSEKQNLLVGQIISFYQIENGVRIINTHRIVGISYDSEGVVQYYYTKGDNNLGMDIPGRATADIIGVYKGNKVGVIGAVVNFFNSPTGFLVCVVLPSFGLVVYCVFVLIKNIKDRNQEIRVAEKELLKRELEDEKERMRKELLQELAANGGLSQSVTPEPEAEPADKSAENVAKSADKSAEPEVEPTEKPVENEKEKRDENEKRDG